MNDDLTLIIDSVFELRFRGQVIIGVLNDAGGLDSHSIDLGMRGIPPRFLIRFDDTYEVVRVNLKNSYICYS